MVSMCHAHLSVSVQLINVGAECVPFELAKVENYIPLWSIMMGEHIRGCGAHS